MTTRAKVSPRTTNPTHTISLSDGARNIGLILDGDHKYLQETPQTPSTLNLVQQGSEYGDADPSLSHIQQSTWNGGRGNQRFVRDATRFYDSKNAWTLTDEVIHTSPQWHFAIGANQAQAGVQPAKNYQWKPVTGLYFATEFTPSANFDADEVYVWLRKVGDPNSLSVSIYSSATDEPDAVVSEVLVVSSDDVTEDVTYHKLTLETPYSLVSGTKYFLVIFGNGSDNRQNHWEIMTCEFPHDYAPLSYTSADATTWSSTYLRLYFKVAEAITTTEKYKLFIFKDEMYAVQIKTSGTSLLYKLVPTTPGFLWASHTDLVATAVASTGLGFVRDVAVVNNIVYFAQGNTDYIRRWNGTTWDDDDDGGSNRNKADIITIVSDAINGQKVYVSIDNHVKSSGVKDWGTELGYSSVHDFKNETVTGIIGFSNSLWIFTSRGMYYKSGDRGDGTANDLVQFNANIDDAYNTTNGRASEVLGQYLYASLDKSVVQIYSSNMTDVGFHHGTGLPSDRVGYITDMRAVFNKLFVAVDAGTGYSSVMVYDGVNWHELWRAPEANKSINSLMWYSGKHVDNPLLVWDYGGDIVFMRFPYLGFAPSKDDTMYYSPSASFTSSVFDMNQVSLPKHFGEISVISNNLYNTRSDFLAAADNKNNARISIAYHADSDIGTDNYIEAGEIYNSPYGTVEIGKDNVYTFQYKVTMLTVDAMKPPLIYATVVKCFARTPIKYQWVLRVKASTNQNTLIGAPDNKPDFILEWLKEKASSAEVVTLHSSLVDLDGKRVIVEPPATVRNFVDVAQKGWGGVITVVLREA